MTLRVHNTYITLYISVIYHCSIISWVADVIELNNTNPYFYTDVSIMEKKEVKQKLLKRKQAILCRFIIGLLRSSQ